MPVPTLKVRISTTIIVLALTFYGFSRKYVGLMGEKSLQENIKKRLKVFLYT